MSLCLSFSAQEESPLSTGGAGSSERCECGWWRSGDLGQSPANSPQTGWLSLQRECDGSSFPVGPVPSVGGQPQSEEVAFPRAAGGERPQHPVADPRGAAGPCQGSGFREACGWAESGLLPRGSRKLHTRLGLEQGRVIPATGMDRGIEGPVPAGTSQLLPQPSEATLPTAAPPQVGGADR